MIIDFWRDFVKSSGSQDLVYSCWREENFLSLRKIKTQEIFGQNLTWQSDVWEREILIIGNLVQNREVGLNDLGCSADRVSNEGMSPYYVTNKSFANVRKYEYRNQLSWTTFGHLKKLLILHLWSSNPFSWIFVLTIIAASMSVTSFLSFSGACHLIWSSSRLVKNFCTFSTHLHMS